MTSNICSSIPEGLEGQLEDTRDGNKYWVGKMKDGKCWMLQNLALGITGSHSTAAGGSTSATAGQSWDFGEWILATPELVTDCGTSGISSLANCTRVGFVDVSSSNFNSGYIATTSNWEGANATNNTLVAVNCTSWSGSGTSKTCTAGTYDAHYSVGNYYSWQAATGWTGGSITSGEASGSICPDGWKLPTSNTTMVGSFAGLFNQYSYNVAEYPLRFIRGGYVSPGSGFYYAGRNGGYWSSTPTSNSGLAHMLIFDTSGVDPSYYGHRYYGYSVRCIAQ